MGLLTIVFSTTFFSWWFYGVLGLQPTIIMVVSAGFYLPFIPAIILSVFLGYLIDLISGGPCGIHFVAFILVLYVCVLAERKLEINSWPFQMLAVGVMSLLSQLVVISEIILINSHFLDISYLFFNLLVQIIIITIISPFFFILLKNIASLIDYLFISRIAKN